jgi:hypothetical protein
MFGWFEQTWPLILIPISRDAGLCRSKVSLVGRSHTSSLLYSFGVWPRVQTRPAFASADYCLAVLWYCMRQLVSVCL